MRRGHGRSDRWSSLCLAGAASANAAVLQSTCVDSAGSQRWTWGRSGQLTNNNGRWCLEIRDGRLLQDAALQMAACRIGWSQQWLLVQRSA